MAISEYYEDDEIISELQMFFESDEIKQIDFNSCLGQVEEVDEDTFQVKVNNRVFQFDKTICDVEEIT